MNAVWIVAVYEGRGTTRTPVPIGTSFAVRCPSMNKLVTAHHLFTQKVIKRDPATRREVSHDIGADQLQNMLLFVVWCEAKA